MKTLIAILLMPLLMPAVSGAAPIPGTSTSKLVSPQIGLYHSPLGFQMNAGKTGWAHSAPPKGNKFIATVYRAQSVEPGSVASQMRADLQKSGAVVESRALASAKSAGVPASLTVRVDDLDKQVALEKYIQKWMKEYPRYGFDVLGSKPFAQNKLNGYVLDIVNREQQKQLRQVIFVKDKRAAILTCRDRVASFQTSLKACNEIIKTFTW